MRTRLGWMRACGLALMLALCVAGNVAAQATVVILVRHAEKAAEPANDPPLTAAGEARAKDLWTAVKDAGVTAIITTQLLRTKATGAPTATALALTPEIVQAGGANHAADVAAAVKRHPGGTVLVVGHSNTVGAIIAALGAARPREICDSQYDNFYVVTIPVDGKPRLVHSRFGAPAPADPTCSTM